MSDRSIELRRSAVTAYLAERSGTYQETSSLFGIGEASLSRWLRRHRETGDVQSKPRGGNNPRRVDLVWLSAHLVEFPDARIIDRIEAWVQRGGRRVGITAMWSAIRACGWTHKKRR